MDCPLCQSLERCREGAHPLLIRALGETTVILGDNQGCAGWCVAVLNEHVEHMDQLPIDRQARVFGEVATVARAIRSHFPATFAGPAPHAPPRINYECLGNQVGHVHWHIIPRHADDPTPRMPVWGWSPEALRGTMSDQARAALAGAIARRLE